MAFERGVEQRISIITYDGQTPTQPTTPAVTLSLDGGAFAPAANSLTHIADGASTLLLTAAETDCAALLVRVTSDNLEPHVSAYYFEAAYTAARADHLDADISTRSTLTAQQVWEYAERTLTSIAAVGAAVWAYATRTITGFTGDAADDIAALAAGGRIILSGPETAITVTGDGACIQPRTADITVTRDDDTQIQMQWAGANITDYTIYMTVRPTPTSTSTDDTDATFQVAAALTTPAEGVFTFTIGKTETDECEVNRAYWYDVAAFAPGGEQTTLLKARFVVSGDVTRRTTP